MILLLFAAGGIYLLLGDTQEAVILLSSVILVVAISLYQEQKTEHALEALRDLSSPRALVIRDGQRKRILGREVVRDDIVVLSEGDRVPADGVILSCTNLSVDESLLTGESVPVRKAPYQWAVGGVEMARPGGDDLPFVYSGTLVVKGVGLAQVQATGPRTEMGKIGKALTSTQPDRSPLQREVGLLVRNLAVAGVGLCALVVVLYGLTRGDWLNGFLAGIALAMAMLPEEFPVVLAIFLALGAWRISQRRVLTRRMAVIETLGSATVLCVDKTGTLTQNRMSISSLYASGNTFEFGMMKSERGMEDKGEESIPDTEALPEAVHSLLEFGILASHRDPFDPMEMAFENVGDRYLAGTEHLHRDWQLVREYPLSQQLLAISHVWQSPGGERFVIAAKGAPEAIIDLCHMDGEQAALTLSEVQTMASEGLRVLGVARAYFECGIPTLPNGQHDFDFEFLGLVGLADPVRPTVRPAIEECYNAGIRVVMITGDYPVTAQSIARQIGLDSRSGVVTGTELDEAHGGGLQERLEHSNIFARAVPEQKLLLVKALKADGEIVAMTGDGVNDAPALKSAHIGIAMGGRGTDVAREAAALVLLDDDFSSIVQAIRLGRRIFDNLKKAMAYILAIHVPIAGMSLIPVMFGWPLVLMPVHIVFLEMVIHPACSIAFEAEPEEANVMRRPPRRANDPLLGMRTIGLSVLQGASVLLVVLAVFAASLSMGLGAEDARTMSFATLVLANMGLILVNRSWSESLLRGLRKPNQALWWVVGGTLTCLACVLYVPFLRDLFHFAVLDLAGITICVTAAVVSLLWFELLKSTGRLRRT
jgi:Ca2+-transporting ATPase